MAAKQFLCSIDLGGNELLNVVFQNLAVAPANPKEGMGYFNTATNKFMLYAGGSWIDITGRVVGITSTTPAVQINRTDAANPIIDILDATAINAGLLTSAFFTMLTNATSANTPDTLVLRDANGDFAANAITAQVVTGLALPVNSGDATNKAYVDNLVSSGVRILGVIDASTNPNYPAGAVGDAYHISVAGKMGGASGEDVEVGDLVVVVDTTAGGDEATAGSDFIIMQKNIDEATNTVAGIVRKATTAEVLAGTDDNSFVTPKALQTKLSAYGAGNVTRYTQVIGDGVNTAFAVAHSFNDASVQTQVFDAATGQKVEVCITNTDVNTVTVTFNDAPANNAYQVIVEGVDNN